MNKFLFFKWKKEIFINLLIILEITVWILTIGQLISLLTFDSNYKNRFKNSFPVEVGVNVYKFIDVINESVFDNLERNHKDNYMISQKNIISKNDINIKEGLKREVMKDGLEVYSDSYSFVEMNYNYINYLVKDMDTDRWVSDKEITPIVLGKNFKKLYSVGDIIKGTDNEYEVIAILDKSLLFSDSSQDLLANSESLNDAIIAPLGNLDKESYYTLIIAGNTLEKSKSTYDELYKLDSNIKGKSINSRLVETIEMLDTRKVTNIFQSLITTALAMFIMILTINAKIDENSEKIGIIMTCGGDSKYISRVFFRELSVLVIISTIISIPITIKLTKVSFSMFYNTNQMLTVFLSFFITLGILLLTISLSLLKIKKLTLRELIGGVRD